jgi:hypothetical protein
LNYFLLLENNLCLAPLIYFQRQVYLLQYSDRLDSQAGCGFREMNLQELTVVYPRLLCAITLLLAFMRPILFCALDDLKIRGELKAYTGIRDRVAI